MRGHAVIIINEKAVAGSKFKKRKGADYDSDNLQRAFCTKLKFNWLNEGLLSRDVSRAKWRHSNKKPPPANCECITCRIRGTDHSGSECFLLVISSHGKEIRGEQIIRFSDGKKVTLSEIINTLSDENCPSLKGKPRVLILQACRSNNGFPEVEQQDPGFEVQVVTDQLDNLVIGGNADDEDDVQPENENATGKSDQLQYSNDATAEAESEGIGSSSGEESDPDVEDENTKVSLPDIPHNFLIVYPTTAGKKAKRSTTEGSWLVAELCKVIDEHRFENNPEMNFLNILTLAAGRVARNRETRSKERLKNAPCIVHRLTAPLIFQDIATDTSPGPSDKPAL